MTRRRQLVKGSLIAGELVLAGVAALLLLDAWAFDPAVGIVATVLLGAVALIVVAVFLDG